MTRGIQLRTSPARGPGARIAAALPLLAALALLPQPARADTLASARGLAARLRSAGRAESEVERRAVDAFTGRTRIARGRLALEPPDRALLEFPATGERIALRGDGGEWLQPALGQMLKLGPEHAAAARRWWELLLPADSGEFSERALGNGRYVVVRRTGASGAPDSAWVTLDSRGLPARLEHRDPGGGAIEYRLRRWTFPRAHGRAGFVLAAPDSLAIVDLP